MSKQEVYAALEAQMITYKDLIDVTVQPVAEPLVPVVETPALVARQLREEMLPYTGQAIYVRRRVAEMLGTASMALAAEAPAVALQVGYGYRALSIQQAIFAREKRRLRGTVPDTQLDEAVHRYIAVPALGGHPAGAAVDVRLLQNGMPVDMGTRLWEFVPDSYTFSPFVSRQARDNRLQLRSAMVRAGFAPFDGEWWHFSYGDKEWARYYDQGAALYEQLEFAINTV